MDAAEIASLLDPGAYDEDTTSVRLLQTHISYLFITDRHVYKVKKAVNFGFLDFSTPELRHHFCREEVRLNRRLCPSMYLGVCELRREGGGLRFRGTGEVVDHAVKMKRLPGERMMSRLVAEGKVEAQDVRRLAEIVARFHMEAETSAEIASFGAPGEVLKPWHETLTQAEAFIGETLEAEDLALLREWGMNFLQEKDALFRRRAAEGHVRDCNGDLHMDNICLTDEICIFDCIEFNDRFRYLDTASDAAFLLMDFDYRRRPDLGEMFLARYLELTGDEGARELLPFYKTYRAMVRGKVESLKLHDPQVPEEERDAARREAETHFRLARGYVLRDRLRQCLVLTCGLSGTGKSTLALELAFELGLTVIRSDVTRKRLAGIPVSEKGTVNGIYTPERTAETYRRLLQDAGEVLDAGRSLVVDATFRTRESRLPFLELAEKRGIPVLIAAAECSEELVRRRLDARAADLTEVSDATWETYLAQKEAFDPPNASEAAVIPVDTARPLRHNIRTILQGMGVA